VSALAEGSEERAQAFIELSEHVPPLFFEELFVETDSSTEIWTCEVDTAETCAEESGSSGPHTGSEFANILQHEYATFLWTVTR
jgi:hypothetical protein